MVAPTFPNLSFENPPGTGPSLVTANAEPYAFSDGDLLELTFAGVSESVVFLESDFADISNATADEVAQLLEARVDDLGASNDGGFVRLTSLLTGEDVSLEVQAGGANTPLGFPAGAVTGETYEGGPPDGWAVVADVDSVNEWAEFADENTRPEEIFDGDGWILAAVSDVLEDAIFDALTIPAPFEQFVSWTAGTNAFGENLSPAIGLLTTFLAESASFGPLNEAFESFEADWGLPIYFAFAPANLLTGISPEDFETGWGQGPAPSFTPDTDFANGTKTAEDFEGVVLTTHIVQLITAAAGEWRIELDSEVWTYQATGADNTTDIATALTNAVNGGSVRFQATNVFNVISIFPVDPADTDFNVNAVRPPGGTLASFFARDFPLLQEEWIGQDNNPDFP